MTEYEADDTVNDLLDDLEQDVIAEMFPEVNSTYSEAWNDAMAWVLERLKTYRRE